MTFIALLARLAHASPMHNLPIHHHAARQFSHLHKREVPQEHSHDFVLTITKEFLNLDNPKGIVDVVFGLLGNAAATAGAGDVTNLDCLKQETADQAFTNAKAAKDLRGMAGALLFQAIERNTGGVGVASVLCNETAVNAEIGALTQHQDPASENAGALNKAITLELAKQLAAIGADPDLALLSGTFAPGDVCIFRSFPTPCAKLLTITSQMIRPVLATPVMTRSQISVAFTPRAYLFWMLLKTRFRQRWPTFLRHSRELVASSPATLST